MPITNPAARSGASLVMALRPTGLSDSSPSVCRKYVPISHHSATCAMPVRLRNHRGGHQNGEGRGGEEQAAREFRGAGRLPPAASQRQPQPGEHRRQHHHEDRLHKLKPARRKNETEDIAISGALGEQAQRRPGLLKRRPEQRRGHEQHQNGGRAFALFEGPAAGENHPREHRHRNAQQRPSLQVRNRSGGELNDPGDPGQRQQREHSQAAAHREDGVALLPAVLPGIPGGGRMQTRVAQVFAAKHVLHQPQQHAQARHTEAHPPTDPLAYVAADQRRNQRPEIDAHVKQREARVAARVALGDKAAPQSC